MVLKYFEGFFSIWRNFECTWANFVYFWANVKFIIWSHCKCLISNSRLNFFGRSNSKQTFELSPTATDSLRLRSHYLTYKEYNKVTTLNFVQIPQLQLVGDKDRLFGI